MPGRTTESTGPLNASRSGVTISSCSGISAPPSCGELLGVRADVLDRAGQEERLLRQRVRLALEDLAEGRDRVLDRHVRTGPPREDLGHEERLAHEPLEPPRSGNG